MLFLLHLLREALLFGMKTQVVGLAALDMLYLVSVVDYRHHGFKIIVKWFKGKE